MTLFLVVAALEGSFRPKDEGPELKKAHYKQTTAKQSDRPSWPADFPPECSASVACGELGRVDEDEEDEEDEEEEEEEDEEEEASRRKKKRQQEVG